MDDWQVGEVRFPRRFQPPPWDGRGVRFDYLKASRFDDTGSALNTATAATDQDGWSLQSLYFGNGAVLSDLTQPLTLTERAGEATDKYVYEVKFQPGYTVNIDNLHNGQGIDYRGRARYLVFLGRIVALHPDEDLKIVGRTVLKRLTKYNPHHDELGRFATGDGDGGMTISSDIPGQVEGGGADLVAGMGGAGTGEVSKPLPEGYEVKSSGHNFYIQGPDGVVGYTGGSTAAESVALYHQNIAGAATHAAPAVTISEPSTAPNYPLPKGYTIEPVSDESSGVVDYAVMQEGHGVIGQFNDHDTAQQFAVEHAATQPEANDNQPPAPSTAGTGGQFKLTGEHLPAQFTVEPDKVSGGFQVLNPDGWSVTHGADAQQAVTAYFNGHPDDALPNGYTYLSGNILDPSGNVVFSAFGSQPAAQVVEEFLNSPKVASGVFVSNSNTMITKPYDQSTAAQTLGQFHLTSYNLPAGWTVAQNATGSYTVSSPDGSTHFYGDNPTEAVNTYFDAHPQDAMPEGFTFTGNSVLDDKGNVVFAGSPNAKPSETIFNYLNSSKAPGQFQIGAGTHVQEAGKPQPTSQPFVPGAEHLPAGYSVQPGTNPGGYSWKVVNPDGAMAGGGFNQDEALHDFFNTHPEAMLPTGYKLNINHEDDTVQITDPTGKTVYDHEYNISGYEAATAFMTGNQTAGSQTTAELFSASTNAPKFVPGEEHLPAGIQVVAGNYAIPFKVVGEDGTSLATGETKEEALKDYFTYHANTLLPAGYQIGYDHIADVPIITDNNGIEVFSGDPGQGGYTAAINYLTANPALAPKAVGGDDLHDAYTLLPKGQAILSGGHGEFKIYDNDGKVVHTGVVGATATETVKEYLNVSSGVPSLSAAPVVHAPGPTEADLPAGVHLVNVTPGEMGGAEFKVYDQSGHSVGGQTSDQALHNYFINHADVLLPTGYKIDDNQSDGLVHITGPNGLEVHVGNANDDIVTTIQDWKAKGTETTSSLGTLPETYFGPGRPGLEPLSEAGLPPGFNVSHERGRGGESTFVGTGEVSPPSQHQVTGDEKQTIYSYTGAGNSAINRFLREDERPDSPSDVTRRIADLDRVFADTSTAKAMTLYRGISENAQAKLDYAIAHSDGHFVDKGFLSTSSSESVAGNWKSGSYVTIEVPPGSKFLDVEHPKMLTSHPGEGEWIGARNQHFVVTKQEKSHYGYGNRTHYFIKLINAGKTQPKDTRQLDLPFVDVGPVNKQEEPYDPNEKYIWQENDIVPIHPEDIANYYRKYNDAHDALGRFAETGSTGSSSETSSGPVPKISSEHEAAIGRYTGKNSSDINQYLRFGTRRGDPAEVSGDIKALDDVLDQNRTTAPTTVWRSIDRNMVKALGKAIDKGQGVIVDKGFTSTSRKQRFASIRDVGYVSIELPTGSPAMDVKPWSRKPEEDETLIGRNQTYHASRDPSDPHHFILKLVPNVGKTGVHLYKVRVRKDDKFTWTPSDVLFLAIKYNMFHDLLGMFSSGDSGGATSEHGSTGSTAASETSINELINPSVLAAQREAVSDYTDEGYYDVNNFLRSNERPTYPTSTDSVIHHLDNLLSTASLPEETTVYRGISKSAAARMDEALANGNTTFTDKGFVSTTRDQHYATVFAASLKHNHAIVDIVLPKGSKALDIATWSSSPDEQETLVQRGSAFKLVGKTIDNDTNAPIYHVRLLSSDPQPTGRSELGKVQTHSAKYVWNGDELDFMTEEELYTKYNHEHGEHGYFASGPGAGLSDDEKTALHDYSANSHSVNHYLRYGQTLEGDVPETVQKTVAALDSAFANTATKEPVMLYRGIGAHEAAMLDHARTGDGTYTDPAFISTTENEHLAEYFVPGGDVSGAPNSGYIEYRVPAGSAAIQLGDLARYHHEQSWLFDRDQTFKVDHIERVNSPQQPNKFKTKYVVNLVPSTKKYNEVHDPHTGEFASGSGGGGGGISLPVQGDARFRTTRSLTQPEKDAVEFYTRTTGYREINAALRRGFSMNNTPETQAHAVNLSKAVASHIVDAPLTVFRGIRNDDLINKFDQAVAAGGGEFTDKGFPSTSFSEHAAQEFTSQFQDSTHYVMRIAVPKGAHALPASIEGLGMNGEDEVILPSGSRFRVTGREQNGNQVVYDAQLVK